ncbi:MULTISPECIES: hypothetical protein [unclassified Streptomyces]|uniref:hypothetical protein n=1 Tax=unclassified Streptomyces TaxID=2593676 RepID=UPI0007099506|nr:hypothetical protein [Streptomyces sp. Root1310]KQX82505.1 hypothetical protein ASD48_04285 [Streptomyces sp. Root1310]
MHAPTNPSFRGDRIRDGEGARHVTQKILITVVTGGGVYLLTNVVGPSEEDGPWQLVLSVLCGGIVLIVQFLASFVSQLADLRESVDKRFADIGEATKLFTEVEKLRGDGVPRLAEHATKVVSMGPDILHEFAHTEIDRLAAQMEDFTNLSAECAGENHDWLLTLTKCARTSIDAISTTVVDDGFWNTEPAGRYLTAQREAILERRISVRRLFIVKRPEELAALEPICAEQREMGIQVQVVALEELPLFLRRGKMIDCIVFDGVLSYEIHADQLSVNTSTTVNARADEVQPLIRRFDQLWEAAAAGTSPNGLPDSVRLRPEGS